MHTGVPIMLSTPPHRKGFRFTLMIATVGAIGISSLSALISLALVGRGVNQQMVKDNAIAQGTQDKIQNIEADQKVQAARAGQGIVGSRVRLNGYVYQETFLEDVIADFADGFNGRKGRVTISDATGRVVGYFENRFICDTIARPNQCAPLNQR
jgi:hypothetical protein